MKGLSARKPEKHVANRFVVGERVFVKPPDARCTSQWTRAQVTGVTSSTTVDVNGMPRHVADLRKCYEEGTCGDMEVKREAVIAEWTDDEDSTKSERNEEVHDGGSEDLNETFEANDRCEEDADETLEAHDGAGGAADVLTPPQVILERERLLPWIGNQRRRRPPEYLKDYERPQGRGGV